MNQEYLDKQRGRIKQKIKILLSKPSFQDEVRRLREKWSIPTTGITDEVENQKWQRRLSEETDRYFDENWEFERDRLNQLDIDEKFGEREVEQKRFNQEAPLNAFHNDIEQLIDRYKLPTDWHHPLYRYLLFNDPENMGVPVNTSVQTTWTGDGKMQLSILINADTIIDDIKAIWSEVKWQQKKLQGSKNDKYQPIPNFERDLRIYELASQKMSYSEIALKIIEEFGEGNDFGFENVSKILYRYRQRLGHK